MKGIFSKRTLLGVVAFVGCIAIAVTAVAIPAVANSTRTITVDTDTVLSEDYHGLGANLWCGPYYSGMNDAYQTVNDQRTNTVKPAYMRMVFMPHWLVDAELTPEEQEYNWTHGIYTWDSEEFKAFARNAQSIYNGGGKILLNMGARCSPEMASWYAIKDVFVSGLGTRSAPRNIDAFARTTVAVINKLKEYGVEVDYLCFHNEVSGGNFEAFFDKRAYWSELIRKTSIELDTAGLRDLAKNKAGIRDGVYIFATELAGWVTSQAVVDFIDFTGKHLIETGYADGISTHQYQQKKDRETVIELSNKLKERYPNFDIFINEFNGETSQSNLNMYIRRYGNNAFSNLLTQTKAGYSGAAIWFYHSTYVPYPMDIPQVGLGICSWDFPSVGLDRVGLIFNESALAQRYIPKHSTTYKTEVDSADIDAATYVKDDDCTVLVEFDKCDTDRTIKVELGSQYAGKTFGIHLANSHPDIDENGVIDDHHIPIENGDLLAVRRETVTADQNGTITWTLTKEDSYVHGVMAFTSMGEQIQVLLEDAELSVLPGGSVDISVKDVFGVDCDDFTFEKYDYSSVDEKDDYLFASKATLDSIGTLEQNASGIATFTASSNLKKGDTIAIKVTPNTSMPEETAGYAIAIIRVGEYRLYLNHKYMRDSNLRQSSLREIGTVEDIRPATSDDVRDPDLIADKGLTFQGWYDNPEFTGEAITKTDASWDSTVHLYGKWAVAENK